MDVVGAVGIVVMVGMVGLIGLKIPRAYIQIHFMSNFYLNCTICLL